MLKIITVILLSLTSSMGKSVSHMVDTPEVYISSVRHDVNKPVTDTVINNSDNTDNDDYDFGHTTNQVDDDGDNNDMGIDDDGDNDDNQWW